MADGGGDTRSHTHTHRWEEEDAEAARYSIMYHSTRSVLHTSVCTKQADSQAQIVRGREDVIKCLDKFGGAWLLSNALAVMTWECGSVRMLVVCSFVGKYIKRFSSF